MTTENSFLSYYLQELSSLEDDCAEFSSSYPQVAGSLGLGREGASDPHLRQLIESVSFIAARLKRQIDSVPGELAHGLLNTVAPHLTAPVPSMSIVKLLPVSDRLDVVGISAPRNFRLRARSDEGDCIFSPCVSDTKLWPLEVDSTLKTLPASLGGVTAIPPDCEQFVLKVSHPRKKIPQNSPGELSFFISGALNRALAAVDAMMLGLVSIRMIALDGSWVVPIPLDQIDVPAFDAADRLIPSSRDVFNSGPLSIEFLNFPRRFCFVRVKGLHCPAPSSGFYLSLVVKRPWLKVLEAVRGHIHLNCLPMVNLYSRPSVSFQLKDAWTEYPLGRDDASTGKWDIFSIDRVQLVQQDKRQDIAEFHNGVDRSVPCGSDARYWQGIRRERMGANLGHAGIALRLIGWEHGRSGSEDEPLSVMVSSTGTNCDAPERLQAAQQLEMPGWDCGYRAMLEFVPSPYIEALLPTSVSTTSCLQVLQSSSGRGESVVQMVRQYLVAHNRTSSPFAMAVLSGLRDIRHELVAIPRSGMPLGAMIGVGSQYSLSFRDDVEQLGSRYLVARLVHSILTQIHEDSSPLALLAEGPNGEPIHVS